MLGFQPGDVVAAYLKGRGFVGIGKIKKEARPIRQVMIHNMSLLSFDLRCPKLGDDADSDELCEHVALVEWIKKTDRINAKWKPRSGLYTTTHVRASLDSQPKTISFLEREFDIDLKSLIV